MNPSTTIIEIDCSTGNQVVREMTEEEINGLNKFLEESESRKIEKSDAEKLKLSGYEKLATLGLSAEEVKALFNI